MRSCDGHTLRDLEVGFSTLQARHALVRHRALAAPGCTGLTDERAQVWEGAVPSGVGPLRQLWDVLVVAKIDRGGSSALAMLTDMERLEARGKNFQAAT